MIAIGWRARSSQVVKCPWQRSPVKRKLKEKKTIINKIKVEHEKKNMKNGTNHQRYGHSHTDERTKQTDEDVHEETQRRG